MEISRTLKYSQKTVMHMDKSISSHVKMETTHTMRKMGKRISRSVKPKRIVKKKKKARRVHKNRIRKSENQIKHLLTAFRKSIIWDRDAVNHLTELCDLSESQIYKWNWDQRKKLGYQIEHGKLADV